MKMSSNTGVRNLYRSNNGYFVYRRPDNGKRFGMGRNKLEAIRSAKELNEKLMATTSLTQTVLHNIQIERVGDHLDYMLKFWEQRILDQRMSATTLETYSRQVKKFRGQFEDQSMDTLSVRDIAGFLEQFPPTLKTRYRAVLSVVWKHAIARGLATVNIAEATLKESIKVKRQRLSLADFKVIREYLEPPFRNAVDLALQTLQRREDISALLKDKIVRDGNRQYLEVIQIKTGAAIRIEIGPELDKVLRCCQDDVVSRFILHYPYQNGPLRKRAGQPFSKDTLTRAFQEARDKAITERGLFKGMISAELPTFHEIRALGAKLYEEAGVDPKALLGHKTAQMTQMYLDRHKVEWAVVKAGLSV